MELDDHKRGEQNQYASQHNRRFSEPQKCRDERFLFDLFIGFLRGVQVRPRKGIGKDQNINQTENVFGQVFDVEQINELFESVCENWIR